jgi:hypothetical protein
MSSRSRFHNYFDYDFIVDTNTVAFSGTSASSPIVAGAAALLWEKSPMLTRDSIKALFKNSAQKDFYTEQPGPTPNNVNGWGKLDIFKAMTGVELRSYDCNLWDTCKDETSPPYPPPPPVTNPELAFIVYPNPASYMATLDYSIDINFTLVIYDSKGRKMYQKVKNTPVANGAGRLIIPTQTFANGIYFLRIITVDGKEKKTLKMVVQR